LTCRQPFGRRRSADSGFIRGELVFYSLTL